MTDISQVVEDNGNEHKYFCLMLHMADDDLDPYEYRLLGHYRRVCGEVVGGKCTESIRTTAQKCQMSAGMVSKARRRLEAKGWIKTEVTYGKEGKKTKRNIEGITVRLEDRWLENVARYSATRSPHEQVGCSPHEDPCSPHETKNNHKSKNNHKELADTPNGDQQPDPKPPTLQHLLFGVFKDVLGMASDAEVLADSMIGRYASWLSGNSVKKHRKSDELVPGCNPPCTPEEARAFLETWVIDRKLSLSPDTVTFADNFYGTRPTLQVKKVINLDAAGGDPLFDPDFANLSPVEARQLALQKQLAKLERTA